jgi:DNA invertase Pin-like site-specific DNA recombinase
MVAAIMSALAEMERSLIRERAAAAREAARARGRHTGRPRALTNEQSALARRMRTAGEPIPTIAKTLGVSRATVYRAIVVSEPGPEVLST